MSFHALRVSKIDRLTSDSVAIQFEIPSHLASNFVFSAGQYVNIQLEIAGKKENRSYSICSSERNQQTISIGVKQIENGKVSTFLNQNIKENDTIEVSEPMGNFLLKNSQASQVFFAGGSGITPILSMIDCILHTTSQNVVLVLSNKNEASTLFFQELQNMANQFEGRFLWKNVYTQAGDSRVDVAFVQSFVSQLSDSKQNQYYVCGPNGIINALEDGLAALGISKDQFAREYFTAKDAEDMESASVAKGNEAPLEKGQKAKVEIRFEGRNYQFECGFNEKIIDAAIDAGAEPPYSCMVAACCTCRAMVKNGSVEMLDKDSLSQKEIDKGYVLSCQALPRTQEVFLDFDE
jgi:ring-1,2-phenylacetyl-CoA epoxidase subunit PaaE